MDAKAGNQESASSNSAARIWLSIQLSITVFVMGISAIRVNDEAGPIGRLRDAKRSATGRIGGIAGTRRLFAANETDTEGEGQTLTSGEGAEVGGVDIVDDGVWILAVEDVYGFNAGSPQIAAKTEFFLETDVQAGVGGEARRVWKADELLLQIDDTERIAGAVLEEIAEFDAPDVSGSPAPTEEAVRGIPRFGAGLLGDVKDGAQGRIEDFVRVSQRARVGAVDFHTFGKNVTEGEGCGAITIFAGVLEEKNAAWLRGLLIDINKSVSTITSEELESKKSVVGEFLLPASAGGGEARLLEAVRGEQKLANDGAGGNDVASGVVKSVDLLLIERLGDEREIQRGVVGTPSQRKFGAIVAEGQDVRGEARPGHGAFREAIPIGAKTSLHDQILRERPSILRVGAGLGVGEIGI